MYPLSRQPEGTQATEAVRPHRSTARALLESALLSLHATDSPLEKAKPTSGQAVSTLSSLFPASVRAALPGEVMWSNWRVEADAKEGRKRSTANSTAQRLGFQAV